LQRCRANQRNEAKEESQDAGPHCHHQHRNEKLGTAFVRKRQPRQFNSY
jgi:hypothetical protein